MATRLYRPIAVRAIIEIERLIIKAVVFIENLENTFYVRCYGLGLHCFPRCLANSTLALSGLAQGLPLSHTSI